MIDIVILREDWTGPRQFVSPNNALWIGSGDDCDVRLSDEAVAPHHVQVMTDDRQSLVMAEGPVAIDGVPMTRRLAGLGPAGTLEVGRYRLRVQTRRIEGAAPARYLVRDDVELGLVEAVLRGDGGATAIYADWLEQHGDPARAELLRIQDAADALAADAEGRIALAGRLRALAAAVDPGWRMLVSNAGVEACQQFELRCPMQWSLLAPTEQPEVRHCAACNQGVHFARSVGEARTHAAAGRCVSLDVLAARWVDDLAPPFTGARCARCGAEVGAVDPETMCPECNHRPPAMRVGRFIPFRFRTAQIRV